MLRCHKLAARVKNREMLTLSSASTRPCVPQWLSGSALIVLSVWLWLVEVLGLEDRALAVLFLRWDLRPLRNWRRLCFSSARLKCAFATSQIETQGRGDMGAGQEVVLATRWV